VFRRESGGKGARPASNESLFAIGFPEPLFLWTGRASEMRFVKCSPDEVEEDGEVSIEVKC